MFKANGKGNAVRLVLSVATVAVLAACSSPQDRKMANRGFEYEESRLEGRAFLVPAGLSTPAFNSNFDIPALPESSREGAIGAKVDVRPPAQLLTVVPGSQVVAKASEPTLVFYALSTSQSVERDTWAFLMNFLAQHKVTTEKLDQQAGVFGDFGIIAMGPDAGKGGEVGGLELLAIRVVPEAHRHRGEVLGADQFAFLRHDWLAGVVPHLHVHP